MPPLHGKIFIAGHRGLVGSAIVRRLRALGYDDLVLRSRSELELEDGRAVSSFFEAERPAYVFLAAARVGGILANSTYPADFIRSNLLVELNVVDAAYRCGVEKLMFLGSSCIYPRLATQPIREDALLRGPLETTNEAYAVAKIAGIVLCQSYNRQFGTNYISVMPTNVYGPGDNFDLAGGHIVPALIRKFHEATCRGDASVEVWGTGRPRREFLHVDDVASACVFLMERYDSSEIINIGCGRDVSVGSLATLVGEIVGFSGEIRHNVGRPDGTPRKLLDVSKLFALGWRPTIELRDGLKATYGWFAERLRTRASVRGMATRTIPRGVDVEMPLAGRRAFLRPHTSDDVVTQP